MCLFFCNLGDSFISLLVELFAGKNVSHSDKQLWRFSKNILIAEKSQSKALLIGHHLEISLLLLMSAENTKTLTYVSLMFCFWLCKSSYRVVLQLHVSVELCP